MDNTQTVYEQAKQKSKQANSPLEETARTKYNLILKTPTNTISLKNTYLEVNDGVLSQVYGVLNLKALYIHKDIKLQISECFAISRYVKIYFIDANGNIVARYKRYKRL
jgi:hypothetical protein